MTTLDATEEAFEMLPKQVRAEGIEVIVFDQAFTFTNTLLKLRHHTLLIMLDGELVVDCNSSRETLKKGEAIMMKKNCQVTFTINTENRIAFRCLLIFFDEPSLRYALMPFEITQNTRGIDFFKIPLNDKITMFTESILLYYSQNKELTEWLILMQNKLRELVWIFFHTDIRHNAKDFFNADLSK